MGFDICFIDDIETKLIAEFKESCIIWVVRCAHSVKVPTLHFKEVLAHIFTRENASCVAIKVVAVNAIDKDALAIDQQIAALNDNAAEADLLL